MLKTVNEKDKLIHLINALCWSYTRADHEMIARLKIFKVLSEGDGSRRNLLRNAWGQNTGEVEKNKTDMSLPTRLMHAFNFLF